MSTDDRVSRLPKWLQGLVEKTHTMISGAMSEAYAEWTDHAAAAANRTSEITRLLNDPANASLKEFYIQGKHGQHNASFAYGMSADDITKNFKSALKKASKGWSESEQQAAAKLQELVSQQVGHLGECAERRGRIVKAFKGNNQLHVQQYMVNIENLAQDHRTLQHMEPGAVQTTIRHIADTLKTELDALLLRSTRAMRAVKPEASTAMQRIEQLAGLAEGKEKPVASYTPSAVPHVGPEPEPKRGWFNFGRSKTPAHTPTPHEGGKMGWVVGGALAAVGAVGGYLVLRADADASKAPWEKRVQSANDTAERSL